MWLATFMGLAIMDLGTWLACRMTNWPKKSLLPLNEFRIETKRALPKRCLPNGWLLMGGFSITLLENSESGIRPH